MCPNICTTAVNVQYIQSQLTRQLTTSRGCVVSMYLAMPGIKKSIRYGHCSLGIDYIYGMCCSRLTVL